MTKIQVLRTMLMTSLLLLPALSSAIAQEEPATSSEIAKEAEPALMTINRFLACQAVEDHEPVGTTDTFAAGTEAAYAYLEATGISADVAISFVWYHGGNEVARVPLSVRQGSRWRTYSSKKLAGRAGAWRVEIQDSASAVLASVDFTVE